MENTEHTCSNCEYFYSCGPRWDQPYPEFTCTKGHWEGISCKEDEDSLYEENDCPDFIVITPPTRLVYK
jgi:hypothetical protein